MDNNIIINCINCDEIFKNQYSSFFKNYEVKNVDERLKEYFDNSYISKDNKLYNEYIKFKFLYDNGGLLLDGNFEFVKNIESFFRNKFFISYIDNKNISTNIIWVKSKENKYVKQVLDLIETEEYSDITDIFSKILNKDLKNNFNCLQVYNNDVYIYPYEYFFPIDYEYIGKSFTDNVKAIYYLKDRKIPRKAKIKIKLARKYGVESFNYFFSILRETRNKIGYKKC